MRADSASGCSAAGCLCPRPHLHQLAYLSPGSHSCLPAVHVAVEWAKPASDAVAGAGRGNSDPSAAFVGSAGRDAARRPGELECLLVAFGCL